MAESRQDTVGLDDSEDSNPYRRISGQPTLVYEDERDDDSPLTPDPGTLRPAAPAPTPGSSRVPTMAERMAADEKLQAILSNPKHPYSNTAADPDLRFAAQLEVGR